jgi:IstB-like ATP binding protein
MRFGHLIILSTVAFAQDYDLIVKGGHVIDPKNNIDAVRDVAIRAGKIAAVSADLPASGARKVILRSLRIAGADRHSRPPVLGPEAWYFGRWRSQCSARCDRFRAGVTTMVDSGTSGWRDFPDFRRRIIDTAQTRVLAFINIIGVGMLGADDANDQNQFDMDPKLVSDMARKNSDVVVGIKTAHWRQPNLIQKCDAQHTDELGYLALDQQTSNLFYQVISTRHSQKRSTIITTNTPFSDWGNILFNTTIATAIADRLVENSEIFLLGGDSLRKPKTPPVEKS